MLPSHPPVNPTPRCVIEAMGVPPPTCGSVPTILTQLGSLGFYPSCSFLDTFRDPLPTCATYWLVLFLAAGSLTSRRDASHHLGVTRMSNTFRMPSPPNDYTP
jgi:hypothetical protein